MMNNEIDDGGTAFPSLLTGTWAGSGANATFAPDSTDGMSIRDWFAGKALAGEVAAGYAPGEKWDESNFEQLARRCWRAADAMLAERKRGRDA